MSFNQYDCKQPVNLLVEYGKNDLFLLAFTPQIVKK